MLTLDKDIKSAPSLPRAREAFSSLSRQLPLPFAAPHTGPDRLAPHSPSEPIRDHLADHSYGTHSVN